MDTEFSTLAQMGGLCPVCLYAPDGLVCAGRVQAGAQGCARRAVEMVKAAQQVAINNAKSVKVWQVRQALMLLAKKADAITAEAMARPGSDYLRGAKDTSRRMVSVLSTAIKSWQLTGGGS